VRSPEFDAYVRDLYWSQAYAMENRRELLAIAHDVLESVVHRPVAVEDAMNYHHNYAVFEDVAEPGRTMYVTRKGAISARRGDRGLIPGAMGQASFVVTGLGNPASYESCAHGAGRVMSRSHARKEISSEEFLARMDGLRGRRPRQRPCSTRRPVVQGRRHGHAGSVRPGIGRPPPRGDRELQRGRIAAPAPTVALPLADLAHHPNPAFR
jgi:hypothetical protein